MPSCKIAVIAYYLRAGGGYTTGLSFVRALKEVADGERFLIFIPGGIGYEEIPLPPNSDFYVYRGGGKLVSRLRFDYWQLPRLVRKYDPDVIWSMGNVGIPGIRIPQAVLVRQAYLFYGPAHYPNVPLQSRLRIAYRRWTMRRSLPFCDLIFCQTPVVKQRFTRWYNFPEDKVKVLPFAVPDNIKKFQTRDASESSFQQSDVFRVLVLTRYLTHRNPSVLIRLCLNYGSELEGFRFITTITPTQHAHAPRFLKQIKKYKLQHMITNVEHLSPKQVPEYISTSDALLFPTLLETLGLPCLEAMYSGLPIIIPDMDFSRYVCGQAALYYDPNDIGSLLKQLLRVKEDAKLRAVLVKAGKEELKKFADDWKDVASIILKELNCLAKRET